MRQNMAEPFPYKIIDRQMPGMSCLKSGGVYGEPKGMQQKTQT